MANEHELFLQMLMGQQPPAPIPQGVIDESGATGKKPEKEAPKKRPGLKEEQWQMISSLLGAEPPPGSPSAPVVKGEGGSGQLLNNPLAQLPKREINPLWLALMSQRD